MSIFTLYNEISCKNVPTFPQFTVKLTRDVLLPDFFKLRGFVEDLDRSIRQYFVCAHFRSFRVKTSAIFQCTLKTKADINKVITKKIQWFPRLYKTM